MKERTSNRQEKVKRVLAHRQPSLSVIMENIRDPHNVSAILRSCDAVGAHRLTLMYNSHEPFPDFQLVGKQSSSGAKKWIDIRQETSVKECYDAYHEQGYKVYASKLDENAISLYDMDLTQKVALVFGNEGRGVCDEAADLADGTFMIPMFGMVQSLNVSVAAAVTLYEALRQRQQAGDYDSPSFSTEELEKLQAEWIVK